MSDVYVFTEMINSAKIGRIALESYLRHHGHPVHVFIGSERDLIELGSLVDHEKVLPMCVAWLMPYFAKGHLGTAKLMAWVLKHIDNKKIIRFDSDIFFKKNCLAQTMEYLNDYDIVGTRRCYGNNPGLVPDLSKYPDTVSTYFMGVNTEKLPDYDEKYLAKMCQGAAHPLGWPVLDFFDPVTHVMMNNGANVCFLDWNEYGSQNEHGKKTNNYELNLHMDCGSKLIHLGGVASGYSYFNNKSNPEKSYAEWALGRWALFAKVFYNEDIEYNEPTVYGNDGRWVSGSYDENILELFKKELQ